MTDTKEKILQVSLRLFAQDGYEAVSVRAIAEELGITKGALYKHYKSKQDIFDSIVARMYHVDAQRSQAFSVPEGKLEDTPEAYRHVSVEAVRAFTVAQYKFWTEDEFATNFRRMLTLEQYRNREMAALYSQCLTAGPVDYMTDIFREMMERGILHSADPRQLATEFYAPMFLLMSCPKSEWHINALEQHISAFMQRAGAAQ